MGRILIHGVLGVEHVEVLGRVLAPLGQDGISSSRVVLQEATHVQHLPVDNHPQVALLVVLAHLS